MGIQINGNTDNIGATDGGLTISDLEINQTGISTFNGNIDANGDLDVDGHTNLDNVSIAGVTTATGNLNLSSGNLQIGGNTVINSGRALYNVESVKLADSKELILGSGNDLKIYHSGSHSFIDEVGNGALKIKGDDIRFENASGTEAARIDSSGRLAFGGVSNNDSYDTNARNILLANESGNFGITIRSGGGDPYAMIHFADGTSDNSEKRAGRIFYHHTSNAMIFATDNTERLRITSAGAVVTGGTTAQASDAVTLMPDGEVTAAGFYFSNNIGSPMNSDGIRRHTTGTICIDTASAERLRINSNGTLTSTASNNGQIIHTFKNTDATGSSSAMTVEQHFNFNRTGGGLNLSAARIVAGKEREWVGGAANQDGFLAFYTALNESPTEKVRITSAGKVGINESSPDTKLHITHATEGEDVVKIEAKPISAGTGVKSRVLFQITQSNNQSARLCEIDSHALNNWGGEMSFSVKNANGTPNDTVTERIRIQSNGSVKFIKEGTPGNENNSNIILGRVDSNNEGGQMAFCRSSDNSALWQFDCYGNTSQPKLRMHRDGAEVFAFNYNGNFYRSGSTISDRDLKENIQNLSGTSLNQIIQLTPRTFNFKESENYLAVPKTGFIAQEVAAVMPSLVNGTDGNKDMGVDFDGIVAHLVNCIKELKAENDDLKTRVNNLEGS